MPSVATEPEEQVIAPPPQTRTGGPNRGGPNDFGPEDRGGGGGGGDDGDNSGYTPGLSMLGMRIMLVSITLLFVVLTLVYLVLSRSKFWQPIRVPPFLWVSTGVILASSWSFQMARRYLQTQQIHRYTQWLFVTVILGFSFLGSQLLALRELMLQGLYMRHNLHGSMFYVITGFHAVHLLAGLAMLLFLLLHIATHPHASYKQFRRERARSDVAALYWHFLDGIWVGMFALMVLLSL
jgi:cytochrome c oxidase subunit 3